MFLSSRGKKIFRIAFVLWLLLTAILIYQYLLHVSRDTGVKGGTFVEAVDADLGVSYLPYTSFSSHNRFYQRFLFSSCLDYSLREDGTVAFSEFACEVRTEDNKRYQVFLKTGMSRSNGSRVSLDDVFYTYANIVAGNVWQLTDLNIYENVSVSKADEYIEVVFPDSSLDNSMFFTHFIVPEKIVSGNTFDEYVSVYTSQPVFQGCARLRPQTIDDRSLIFDLSDCDETNILLYQVKLIENSSFLDNLSLYDLIQGVEEGEIVDRGVQQNNSRLKIPSRQYSMLFFNTQSSKLSSKINRALGGFIFHHFYSGGGYEEYLLKDHLLFDSFLSTGDNVANYIAAKNPNLPVDKYDLEKISINQLPQTVSLMSGSRLTYFLEEFQGYKTIKFSVPDGYSSVTISHNKGLAYTPRTYDASSDTFFYSLAVYNSNIDEGLNEYVIEGVSDDGSEVIGTIDLYYLSAPLENQETTIPDSEKLTIIYYTDTVSQRIVDRLKTIFSTHDLEKYFVFEAYSDVDQFDGKLLSLDYDIVIRTVDLGLRVDLSGLLGSTVPTLNPAVYTYEPFVSALSEYANGRVENTYQTILNIYMQDVPFLVMGNIYDIVYVRKPFVSVVNDVVLGVYDFKKRLLKTISLNQQQSFDRNDVFDFSSLESFINTL